MELPIVVTGINKSVDHGWLLWQVTSDKVVCRSRYLQIKDFKIPWSIFSFPLL